MHFFEGEDTKDYERVNSQYSHIITTLRWCHCLNFDVNKPYSRLKMQDNSLRQAQNGSIFLPRVKKEVAFITFFHSLVGVGFSINENI